MISSRSNISSKLKKKRNAGLIKKIRVYFFLMVLFISLAIWGLTADAIRIKDIQVSGNNSVPQEEIIQEVNNELARNYLWFIPTDNLFLLRRSEIRNHIFGNIKEIGKVKIVTHGFDQVEIIVTERKGESLWCAGTPTNKKSCYFMDADGFIFEGAPTFSDNAFAQYFGLVNGTSTIGQYYFKDSFKKISGLFAMFKKISFQPLYFNALNLHEYEVYITGGGKILINDKKDFESSLMNLQALVTNGYIKTDADSLKKIKYIDLRFGNKVNFDLN